VSLAAGGVGAASDGGFDLLIGLGGSDALIFREGRLFIGDGLFVAAAFIFTGACRGIELARP